MSTVTKTAGTSTDEVLTVRSLQKSLGRVHALREATLTLTRGKVTALIGDNGAGKSTLVRCLVGVHSPDSGEIRRGGEPVHFANPEQGRSAGIETVFQELALVEDLSVAQNLFLGREATRGFGPLKFLDRRKMRKEAHGMVSQLAINVPQVTSRVRRLSGVQRQAVALARAAGWSSSVVILDEPTAALGVQETHRVEQLLRSLREKGMTILLISHNLDQVLRLSDQVVVIRAGRTVARRDTSDTNGQELVALVTGAQQDADDNDKPDPALLPERGAR